MKLNKNLLYLHKNNSGVAHLVLILITILIFGVGGAGYYVYQHNRKPTRQSSATSTLHTPATTAMDCPGAESDKTLCTFIDRAADAMKGPLKAVFTNTDSKGNKTTSYFETDGMGSISFITKSRDTEVFGFIALSGATYIKNINTGTWTKYLGDTRTSTNTNPTSDLKFQNDKSKQQSEWYSYKYIGKETCGSVTCLKYQMTIPTEIDAESFLWIGETVSTLHKQSLKQADGSLSIAEFTFTKVTIHEPSPIK